MTEIKTNKLTKETGKENREGKMKEDVQMTDAENKTGAEAGTQQSEMAQGEDFFQEWLK